MENQVFRLLAELKADRSEKIKLLPYVSTLLELQVVAKTGGLMALENHHLVSGLGYPFFERLVHLVISAVELEEIRRIGLTEILTCGSHGIALLRDLLALESATALAKGTSLDILKPALIAYFGLDGDLLGTVSVHVPSRDIGLPARKQGLTKLLDTDSHKDLQLLLAASLIKVSDENCRAFMTKIPPQVLILSLAGADEFVQKLFWRNLGTASQELIKEDIEALDETSFSGIQDAMRELASLGDAEYGFVGS